MKNNKQQAKKLQAKYLQDQIFQKEVDERFKKYQVLLQQSMYSDLSCINQQLFVCYNRGEYPIYFYFGMLQNNQRQNLHKLTMFFVKFFNRKPNQVYSFVFVNTKASSEAYGLFKQIFSQLTINHFINLKQFILLRPSYYHRAQDYLSFNVFTNYLRNITIHFYNAGDLCSHLNMSSQEFVDIVPKQIAQAQFPSFIPRKFSLEDQRINFSGHLLDQHQKALRVQFQTVMKSFLISKPGKQTHSISDYQLNRFGVPVILQILIYYFKAHPQGLKLQGLFRKSVSIDQQNETLNELINKNYDCLLNVSNPHIIANLIKRFFSNLKTPIIPYKQFDSLMHDQGISDKKQNVKDIISTLPQLNHTCLLFLLQFLKNDVIINVAFNKMTSQNISICFAPCLLRAQKASAADIIYASKCAIVTRILLDSFQEIFGSSQQIQLKFRKSQEMKSQNFQLQIQQSIKAQKNERLSKNCAFKIVKRVSSLTSTLKQLQKSAEQKKNSKQSQILARTKSKNNDNQYINQQKQQNNPFKQSQQQTQQKTKQNLVQINAKIQQIDQHQHQQTQKSPQQKIHKVQAIQQDHIQQHTETKQQQIQDTQQIYIDLVREYQKQKQIQRQIRRNSSVAGNK